MNINQKWKRMVYYLILQHEWPLNAKVKKPDPKDRMMYDSIYMKKSRTGKSTETEKRLLVA